MTIFDVMKIVVYLCSHTERMKYSWNNEYIA